MLKELNYFKKILYSNLFRLDFPHKISYIFTYRCNLRCKICNIWKKKPVEELNLNDIERFFKKSNKFSWIGITGGEPFLREDILQSVKIILDNCKELVAINFASNGIMTDKIMEVTENALNYKNKNIKLLFSLSIDGPSYLHDEIRGVRGAWLKTVDTFKRLRKMKSVQVRINYTASSYNFDKFPETFASLKEAYPKLKFDDITINMFHKSGFYYNNENMPELDYSSVVKAIDKILKIDEDFFTINNFLRRKYLRLYQVYAQYRKCPLRCQALSSSCIVDPEGDIYPCGIYGVKIANIKQYDYNLNTIWSQPHVNDFSVKCSRSMCPSCWLPCDAYSAIAGSLFKYRLWRI